MNEFNPMSEEELRDKGPWTVSEDGHVIESDDFTHDVMLRVGGDFYSDEQRKAYSENLAAKLNANEQENEKLKADVAMLRESVEIGYDFCLAKYDMTSTPLNKLTKSLSATASLDAWLKEQKAKVLEEAACAFEFNSADAMFAVDELRRMVAELRSPESDIDQQQRRT